MGWGLAAWLTGVFVTAVRQLLGLVPLHAQQKRDVQFPHKGGPDNCLEAYNIWLRRRRTRKHIRRTIIPPPLED